MRDRKFDIAAHEELGFDLEGADADLFFSTLNKRPRAFDHETHAELGFNLQGADAELFFALYEGDKTALNADNQSNSESTQESHKKSKVDPVDQFLDAAEHAPVSVTAVSVFQQPTRKMIDVPNKDGHTPLFVAVYFDSHARIKQLLDAGADMYLPASNPTRCSPYEFGLKYCDAGTREILENHHRKLTAANVNGL